MGDTSRGRSHGRLRTATPRTEPQPGPSSDGGARAGPSRQDAQVEPSSHAGPRGEKRSRNLDDEEIFDHLFTEDDDDNEDQLDDLNDNLEDFDMSENNDPNADEDPNDDNEDSDNDNEVHDEDDGPEHDMRPRRSFRFRAVNCMEKALNPENYDPYIQPEVLKQETAKLQDAKPRSNIPEETITWTNQKPGPGVGRRPAEQLLRREGGCVNRPFREMKEPADIFGIFLTDETLELVVRLTNKRIRDWTGGFSAEEKKRKKQDQTETDLPEIKAWLGLHYIRGLYQHNLWLMERLWDKEIGPKIYNATMSMNRYKFIMRFVTFDNKETRAERYKKDKFAAMRNFFEDWNVRCAEPVQCSAWVTIDECLYPSRGRQPAKCYNPSKPAKYGVNMKDLNEVTFPFTYGSQVYAGKPEQPGDYHIPTTEGITLRLLENYGWNKLQGVNLTTDNLYSSIPLARKLLAKKMTFLGTLRKNRRGLTPNMKKTHGRDHLSTIVWFEKTGSKKLSLTSYVSKSKSKGWKNILVLSSIPNLATIGFTKDDTKKKSGLIKVYDFTKGGTDIVDQRVDKYTTKRKTNKWTHLILSYMLDVTRVNSQSIHSLNHGKKPRKEDSFKFGWDLAMQLMTPHIARRMNQKYPRLSRQITLYGTELCEKRGVPLVQAPQPPMGSEGDEDMFASDDEDEDEEDTLALFPHSGKTPGKKRRCGICTTESTDRKERSNLTKLKTQCQSCAKPCCENHSTIICLDCVGKLKKKSPPPVDSSD